MLYNMNGAINEADLNNMSRRKFLFYLKQLKEQKKRENDEFKRSNKSLVASKPTGKMKYLG